MNKLFEKLNQLSVPMIVFIASSLTIISILPFWIYIANQKTNIRSKAVGLVAPSPVVIEKPTDGPIPKEPPIITRVYPWVGKTGDVIVIEGKNFGVYPKNRRLAIGDTLVSDLLISLWTDTQIEAIIPKNPKQGGTVTLRIDTHPIAESVPLTFYDQTATVRVHKTGTSITATGLSGPYSAVLYTKNGQRKSTGTGAGTSTLLFTLTADEAIQSIMLLNQKQEGIPYSINPTEFGF
jgi:hypothetical protein